MAIHCPDKNTETSLKNKNAEAVQPRENAIAEKCDKEATCDMVKKFTRCFMAAFFLGGQSGDNHTLHILRVGNILGLNLVHRGQGGSPTISKWAVLSVVVINIICLASIPPVLIPMFRSGYFWYKVILLPYSVGFFLCLYIYARVIHHRYNLMAFLEAIADMKVPIIASMYRLVVWTYLYPLVIAVCSMVLFFGSQQLAFAPSILVVSFVPAVLDVYMGSLARVLQLAIVRLTEQIESQDAWTLKKARMVMEQWFHLTELFNLYNKVRPP